MSCSQPLQVCKFFLYPFLCQACHQIISTGDQDEACQFILNEENLNSIIGKIPPDMKVGVIAVVGAFRTGKSFLLNFFLRYLRNSKDDDLTQAWMVSEGI
jgi:atlastin